MGGSIKTIYNMIPYKSKLMHAEDDTLNLSLSDRT